MYKLNRVILTKDNLKKGNWQGCSKCCFYDQDESIHHLFVLAPVQKYCGVLST
jgi:hypothetical protein